MFCSPAILNSTEKDRGSYEENQQQATFLALRIIEISRLSYSLVNAPD